MVFSQSTIDNAMCCHKLPSDPYSRDRAALAIAGDRSLLLSASYVAERALVSWQKELICVFVVCLVPAHRANEMVLRAHKWMIEIELDVIEAGSIWRGDKGKWMRKPRFVLRHITRDE
jgi:hypothetical protein